MAETLRLVLTTANYNYIKDGVALTLNRLVAWLGQHDVEVMVVAPQAKTPAFVHEGRLEAVRSFPIPFRGEYRIGLPIGPNLAAKIRAFNPHLFHIASPEFTGHSALRLARDMERPVVASYHTRFDTYLQYYHLDFLRAALNRSERALYDNCEHLYVPSFSMMDELRAAGMAGDNMRLWARGVDHERFTPAKRSRDWRQAHGIADDDVLIAYAGRLVAEKNMALMSRVFSALDAKPGPQRTILLGDGPEAGWMRKAMPNTVFAGFLHGDDLATAYASSDIFFFPSISETFGNVTLEAMASGLPAVTADAAGSRSLVREGETGFLVDASREDIMIDRLTQLVADPQMRSRFGARARDVALAEYDWDKIFSGLLADYREAVAGFRTRG